MEAPHHNFKCRLTKPLKSADLPPTSQFWKRCSRRIRKAFLPCAWHHGSLVYIRSRKCLQLERENQLRNGYWFIWHPYSPVKFYWDSFVMLSYLCAKFYMPWQVFYHCSDPADPLILATDFIAFCDIIVLFISGYYDEDNKQSILEPKKIALRYIKGTFVFDLIGAMPLQLYEPYSDCMYPSHTIFFPLKLLRVSQLGNKIVGFLEQSKLPYSCTALTKVFLLLSYFFHWMTYLHYQVPAFCAHYYEVAKDNTTIEAAWLHRFKVDSNITLFEKYVTNLYFVSGICIGAGYFSPNKSHVPEEMILNCFTGFFGLIFLSYCFMQTVRLVLYSQYQRFAFDSKMENLEKYMISKRLPNSLQDKIKRFINYKFCGRYLNQKAILNTINKQIKVEMNLHSCKRLVAGVPLFRDLPIGLVNSIIFSLRQETLIPGQKVLQCGEPYDGMYFISFGTVAVIDENGRELAHLEDEAFFGESAILRPGEPATINVIALEITEIYVLDSHDFMQCIQPYPHLKRRLHALRRRIEMGDFPANPYL